MHHDQQQQPFDSGEVTRLEVSNKKGVKKFWEAFVHGNRFVSHYGQPPPFTTTIL